MTSDANRVDLASEANLAVVVFLWPWLRREWSSRTSGMPLALREEGGSVNGRGHGKEGKKQRNWLPTTHLVPCFTST